jgi:predicted esterase YcpF (UPF0227 family)
MKLLYVHGYNCDPYGNSYNNLKNSCGDNYELHTIDYDLTQPKEAVNMIHEYVSEHKIDVVIGASLGGFLTMNVFGVSRIVVNPCWDPAVELPKIGYTESVDEYAVMLEDLKEHLDFEECFLCSGVFASDDEMLGNKYMEIFRKYFRGVYLIDGTHRISAEMAERIINDILPHHEEEATDFCSKLKEIDNAPWFEE